VAAAAGAVVLRDHRAGDAAVAPVAEDAIALEPRGRPLLVFVLVLSLLYLAFCLSTEYGAERLFRWSFTMRLGGHPSSRSGSSIR